MGFEDNLMPNVAKEIDLPAIIKPGTTEAFSPIFEVEAITGREKKTGDYAYVSLKPVSGGANVLGKLTLQLPSTLAPGTPLAVFAALVGQNPEKGFSVKDALGRRISLTLAAVEPAEG